MSTIGHNSVASEEGLQLLDRVARLEEEKKGISDDIKDVWAEAKSRGFDVRTLREAYKHRKAKAANPKAYAEQQSLLETYLIAFGIEN